MISKLTKLILALCLAFPVSLMANNYWHQADAQRAPANLQVMHPTQFLVYTMDEAALKFFLWNLSTDPNEGQVIALPLPDGSFRNFKVWQSPMMPDRLAARYPGIKTFTAEAVSNHTITAKLEFTLYGFSAMIFDGDNTSFIDPFDNYRDGFYMVHYKRDEVRDDAARMKCLVEATKDQTLINEPLAVLKNNAPKKAAKTSNGLNLRTYRLALSANHYYCQAATGSTSPTIAEALSKMTISMNRVNGVYNREFSVQMNFCANEDTLIWPTATGSINGNDTFSSINSNGSACLSRNQSVVTARIGSSNYDLGHVFTTGGGGISSLGVVCNSGSKAQSVTGQPTPVGDGFDIDYVAHEMGHEFGSQHTFNNNNNGSCSGNAVSSTAYEPGSGATIMDYAGICSPDNLQPHSDAYFSASSLVQIQNKLAGSENACAVITSTGNELVSLASFTATYNIPYKTPFELIGPGAVPVAADTAITYGWAQWNRGDFGKTWATTYVKGPIIRSYNPAYTPNRVIPKLSTVLAGATMTFGEKAPDTARYLTFKMAVRNILAGNGCFLFPDDTIHVEAISTGAANGYQGFKVTSQATTVTYTGGTTQTITWDVVGTDAAPVNAANVNIYVSIDGGNTWPYSLGTFANNGSASVILPNPPATSANARIKVKGQDNIFFNINRSTFTLVYDPGLPVTSHVPTADLANTISIAPVPATTYLNINSTSPHELSLVIYNTLGQAVSRHNMSHNIMLPLNALPGGIYYVRFTDAATGAQAVKQVVIQ